VLVQVDEGFREFAAENGWGGAGDCLGRNLWDFVADSELTKLQRMLLRRVRAGAGSVDLPFRCDGPDVRRELDIHIAASQSGRLVRFSARQRHEEARPHQPLLDHDAPRGPETITMCGWCDRFLVEGEWVEVEEAAKRLGLFRRSKMPAISHDICPDCSELLLAA